MTDKKSKTRLIIEVLLILVLFFTAYSYYSVKNENKRKRKETERSLDDLGVSKLIKKRADKDKSKKRIFGREKKSNSLESETTADQNIDKESEQDLIPATLIININDLEGNPVLYPVRIFSRKCGFTNETSKSIMAFHVPPGVCVISAEMVDPLLSSGSAVPIRVNLKEAQREIITLNVPMAINAGIGVEFFTHPEWIEVTNVSPEGPADRAGIQPGDIIIQINDLSIASLKPREIRELLIGRHGSEIELLMGVEEAGTFTDARVNLIRAIGY